MAPFSPSPAVRPGSPAALLVTDGPLLGGVALWAAVAVILYSPLGY